MGGVLMKDDRSSKENVSAIEKKTYVPPRLVHYGSLAELTRSVYVDPPYGDALPFPGYGTPD